MELEGCGEVPNVLHSPTRTTVVDATYNTDFSSPRPSEAKRAKREPIKTSSYQKEDEPRQRFSKKNTKFRIKLVLTQVPSLLPSHKAKFTTKAFNRLLYFLIRCCSAHVPSDSQATLAESIHSNNILPSMGRRGGCFTRWRHSPEAPATGQLEVEKLDQN